MESNRLFSERIRCLGLRYPLKCGFVIVISACATNRSEMKNIEQFRGRAIQAIREKYPSASENEEDYEIFQKGLLVTVSPRIPKDSVGGGPSADIRVDTGKVMRVYFSE